MSAKIQEFLKGVFEDNLLNRLPDSHGGGRIFADPVIGASRGDDPIFQKYKEVVGPEHLTPAEMWTQSGFPDCQGLVSQLYILSIVFPYVDQIREAGKLATGYPPDIYSIGRNFADDFMFDVLNKTITFLQHDGFQAMDGVRSKVFSIIARQDPPHFYSVWSERHIAFAAGLGTFSLHEGFITEVGCNHRVASLITDAPLEVTQRRSDDPYANCLFYSTGKCKKCVDRCPGDALSPEGHDKLKCREYGQITRKNANDRLGDTLKPRKHKINNKEKIDFPTGCGLCQFGVPCTSKNPMANAQKK
jgi:epoxyqueuosine reductase